MRWTTACNLMLAAKGYTGRGYWEWGEVIEGAPNCLDCIAGAEP